MYYRCYYCCTTSGRAAASQLTRLARVGRGRGGAGIFVPRVVRRTALLNNNNNNKAFFLLSSEGGRWPRACAGDRPIFSGKSSKSIGSSTCVTKALTMAQAQPTGGGGGGGAEMEPRAAAILDFWWGEGWKEAGFYSMKRDTTPMWFGGGEEIDAEIHDKFSDMCEELLKGGMDGWQNETIHDALAGIILGDQFFRNVYRGTPKMYAADEKVIQWSRKLLPQACAQLPFFQRMWVLLPHMHSENLKDQDVCVTMFEEMRDTVGIDEDTRGALDMTVEYAKKHRDMVATWGRFPYRNAILGRESTQKEKEALDKGEIVSF